MADTIRVGVIGTGRVAQERHIPRLQSVPDVAITHAWSRTSATAESAAREFGIPVVARDWEEIVESDVDAVVIATPPILHLPATLAALGSGKHVLCQARMARNLSEAHRMLAASRATELVTSLYPPLPGLKGDRLMRRLLHDERYVGDILDVRVSAMAPPTPSGWQTDREVVGVNATTLGILAEVFNRWVGPARSIAAASGEDRQAVPQSLAVSAKLEGGATASFHLAFRVTHGRDSAMEIYGTRGTLVYRFFVEELTGAAGGDEALRPIEIPTQEERRQTTDAEFIEAIRNGTPVSPDFAEGVRYMEFSEAVAQSLYEGGAVSMPPEPKMDSWGRTL